MSFKVKDHFYKKAKKESFLARSIYKLEEIDKKYKVLKAGDNLIDLGYHPGSWVQYAATKVGRKGSVIGIDIKPVNKKLVHLDNINLYEQDVFEFDPSEFLGDNKYFDVVLSDMAPNTTGIKSVDQDRSLALVESVFELLPRMLKVEGNFVIKVFDSNDAQVFLKSQKKRFHSFDYFKPKSTRSVSKEFFLIAKGFKGE